MRIDPEAIYLEPTESVWILNRDTGETRANKGVYLHFKHGGRWQKRLFDAPTFEATLTKLGKWLDEHGIEAAVEQAA